MSENIKKIVGLFDEITDLEFDMSAYITSAWYAAKGGDWALSAKNMDKAYDLIDDMRNKARLLKNKIYDCKRGVKDVLRVARKE